MTRQGHICPPSDLFRTADLFYKLGSKGIGNNALKHTARAILKRQCYCMNITRCFSGFFFFRFFLNTCFCRIAAFQRDVLGRQRSSVI